MNEINDTATQSTATQENRAIGVTTTKKLGGLTLNLPPAISLSSIYELFYFNNGNLNTEESVHVFSKSLLINRTKHKAWEESNNYISAIEQDIQNQVYYGFSNFGKIPCNMGSKETWKRTALAYEESNNEQDGFTIAPAYKISFDKTSDTLSKLNIEIYNNEINGMMKDENDEIDYIYSYEEYLKNKFGQDVNGVSKYIKNQNNKQCLRIPHAVSHQKINNGKFLFNVGLLNVNPTHACSIEFKNCDLDYKPTKLYSGTQAHTIATDTIFDITSTNISSLFNSLRSVNTTFKNDSFLGILNERHQYSKLRISPKNATSVASIIFKSSDALPAEINDLKTILETLSRWFTRSSYATTHAFPSFSV